MYFSFLETIASISGTLIGFVGIVFMFGRRAEGKLTDRERSGLFHLLYTSSGALLFSLLMLVALAELGDQLVVWQIGTSFVALNFLYGTYKVLTDEKRDKHGLPKIVGNVSPIVALSFLVLNSLCATGIIEQYSRVIFSTSMIMLLIISLTYFLAMLMADLSNK